MAGAAVAAQGIAVGGSPPNTLTNLPDAGASGGQRSAMGGGPQLAKIMGALKPPAGGCSVPTHRRWWRAAWARGRAVWSRTRPAAASTARRPPSPSTLCKNTLSAGAMSRSGGVSCQSLQREPPARCEGFSGEISALDIPGVARAYRPLHGWQAGQGSKRGRECACEYHTMPSMAVAMPRNFLSGISSPKNRQPPVRMITVLMWPTTLYVRLDVAPMTCAQSEQNY